MDWQFLVFVAILDILAQKSDYGKKTFWIHRSRRGWVFKWETEQETIAAETMGDK